MAEIARGEVWWAAIPDAREPHPVLVLTRDAAIPVRNRVTVAPVSTIRRGIPVEVVLDESDGMDHECVLNLDDIATIPKHLLGERVCRLPATRMHEVRAAVMAALGL